MSDIEARWPRLLAEGVTTRRLASTLLEATALAHGLDTVRINGDSFVAGSDPLYTAFGFWGGLSSETSRSAVRTTRDRIKRKAALSRVGVRVPQSRRFGYRHVDQAVSYAQRFSRGIMIKPRALSAGSTSRQALTEPDQVREAIASWKDTPGSGADYLVEARIHGPEFVFYIIADRVESVVRRRNRAWSEEVYRHGSPTTTDISPEVLELARRSLQAMPRTLYGEVRIAGQNALVEPARCRVISVRPTIELINGRSTQEWSLHMADRLVAHGMRNYRTDHRAEAQAHSKTQLTVTEVANADRLGARVDRWLRENGLEGKMQSSDRELSGVITGTPGEVASLSSVIRTGQLLRQFPQTVKLRRAVDDA